MKTTFKIIGGCLLTLLLILTLSHYRNEQQHGDTAKVTSNHPVYTESNRDGTTNFISITKKWSESITINEPARPSQFKIVIGAMDRITPYQCLYNDEIGSEWLDDVPAYNDWDRERFHPNLERPGGMTVKIRIRPDSLVETSQVYYVIRLAR